MSSGKKIDVLWLIEHVARELDVACVIKAIIEKEYGLIVEIRNLYEHIKEYLVAFEPTVVVHPFVYVVKGALATEDVFARWPDAIHVNVAWEQIHYEAKKKFKAPSDEITRSGVLHFAWGNFFREYLIKHGVQDGNIIINGHPAYQLYMDPYREFFSNRTALGKKFGLSENKRWIFVPENYLWAFAGRKIDFFVSQGADRRELMELVEFSAPSLRMLLKGCREVSMNNNIELIFRPRPSVSTKKILDFFHHEVGPTTEKIRFIKEGSVREWILASDMVISSYSTSLLEASIAGKPAWMFEPIPMPDSLHCDWYDHAPRLRTPEEFVYYCNTDEWQSGSAATLAAWAYKNLLPGPDPIQRMAVEIGRLCQRDEAGYRIGCLPEKLMKREYFNKDTHEMDSFTEIDVYNLSRRWAECLYRSGAPIN